jgi:hypothetical protein
MLALSDAYELGLALEPKEALAWKHAPAIMEGVSLDGANDRGPALVAGYCRNYQFTMVDYGAYAQVDPSLVMKGKQITIGNVYDINRPGSTKVERVVFGSAGFNEDGTHSSAYTPVWTVVNVTIAADADINSFVQESDIATVNMDKTFTKASPSVVSVTASTTRSTRVVQF